MREIFYHKSAADENGNQQPLPGAGPQVLYRVYAEPHDLPGQPRFDAPRLFDVYRRAHGAWEPLTRLGFQRGPYKEQLPNGDTRELPPNGLTNEVLLAVLIDRMENYQWPHKGVPPLPCPQNDEALGHLKAALAALHARTADRVARGVEGGKQP